MRRLHLAWSPASRLAAEASRNAKHHIGAAIVHGTSKPHVDAAQAQQRIRHAREALPEGHPALGHLASAERELGRSSPRDFEVRRHLENADESVRTGRHLNVSHLDPRDRKALEDYGKLEHVGPGVGHIPGRDYRINPRRGGVSGALGRRPYYNPNLAEAQEQRRLELAWSPAARAAADVSHKLHHHGLADELQSMRVGEHRSFPHGAAVMKTHIGPGAEHTNEGYHVTVPEHDGSGMLSHHLHGGPHGHETAAAQIESHEGKAAVSNEKERRTRANALAFQNVAAVMEDDPLRRAQAKRMNLGWSPESRIAADASRKAKRHHRVEHVPVEKLKPGDSVLHEGKVKTVVGTGSSAFDPSQTSTTFEGGMSVRAPKGHSVERVVATSPSPEHVKPLGAMPSRTHVPSSMSTMLKAGLSGDGESGTGEDA